MSIKPGIPTTQDFNDQVIPEIAYNGNGDIEYHGQAVPGSATSAAVWFIRNYTYDGSNNLTAIRLANGSTVENQIWDNRAALSYS